MEAILQVKSKFDKKDYKNYLFLASFKEKKSTLPFIFAMPLVISIIISYFTKILSLKSVIFLYLPFVAIALGVVLLKIAISLLKIGLVDTSNVFDTYNTFTFFEDNIQVENEKVEGASSFEYKHIYKVLESKEYFLFYFSNVIVSIVKKQDIEDYEKFSSLINLKLGKKYKKI